MAYPGGNYPILSVYCCPAGTTIKFSSLFILSKLLLVDDKNQLLLSLIKISDNFLVETSTAFLLHKMNHLIRSDVVWDSMLTGKPFLVSLNGCSGRSTAQREENQFA